ISNVAEQTHAFAAQITDKEQQIADLRRSLAEIDRAISDAVNRDHGLKGDSDRHQQRIGSNTERITEFEQLIANHHRETAGSEENIRDQEQRLASLNAELAQLDLLFAPQQSKLQA